MKFLIVGLGSIGRRHFRNLIALGERDLVLLRSHRSTLPDDELSGFPVETDITGAIRKHGPDAVIVANPTSLHLNAAIPAAEAGCHILLEKPVSHSLEGLDDLQKAAGASGSRILVGFQFRYHPALLKARELIQKGELGGTLSAHAHWGEYLPNWHPWEDYRQGYAARADLGGGVIVTLTHPLDYLRFLLGDITDLWSLNGHISPLEVDVEDAAEIGLKFAGGAVGGVHVNYFQRPPVHRLEIVGTQGTLHWDNSDGVLRFQRMPAPFGTYSSNPPGAELETFSPPEGFERNQLFLAQTRHFIDVVSGKAGPLCTLEDGIEAMRLASAAKESQAFGRMVTLKPFQPGR
jgi:predicted dehydrogenase